MNYIMSAIIAMLLKLKISDLISLVSALISALSLVGALITYIIKSYNDYKKKIEEMKPNVFISYEKGVNYQLYSEKLILKNYGKTTAWIKSISIKPEFKNIGSKDYLPNTFSSIKDFPLAPGQELSTMIGASGREDNKIEKSEKRKYVINYESEDRTKKYTSEYIVNEEGYPVLLSTDKSRDVIELRNAITSISNKLEEINNNFNTRGKNP